MPNKDFATGLQPVAKENGVYLNGNHSPNNNINGSSLQVGSSPFDDDDAETDAFFRAPAPMPKRIVKEETNNLPSDSSLDLPRIRFKPLSLDDILDMPQKQWLIDQFIGAGDLAMIYGAPGCGKTFIVIDMIFSACLGRQFAMRFGIDRPLSVAYCAGEGVGGLKDRFAAAADFYGVNKIPNLTIFATTPQLYVDGNENSTDSIKDFVIEWKNRQDQGDAQPLDILIIDTLHSATAGADENSARDMGIVLKLAKDAAQILGCAVVLVHHTNKNGTAERGSSAMRGAMDTMIEIRRISDTGTKAIMQCAKLKDGQEWKEQTFDLVERTDSVRVWWDEPGDGGDKRKSETGRAILQLLTSMPGKKLTTKQISEATDTRPQTATKVLARLEKDKLVERHQNERSTWCFLITPEGTAALQNTFNPI